MNNFYAKLYKLSVVVTGLRKESGEDREIPMYVWLQLSAIEDSINDLISQINKYEKGDKNNG